MAYTHHNFCGCFSKSAKSGLFRKVISTSKEFCLIICNFYISGVYRCLYHGESSVVRCLLLVFHCGCRQGCARCCTHGTACICDVMLSTAMLAVLLTFWLD